MAIGTKRCFVVRFKYLAILLAAALFTASPASVDLLHMLDSAKVSMIVTSYARVLPLALGINVAPFGH